MILITVLKKDYHAKRSSIREVSKIRTFAKSIPSLKAIFKIYITLSNKLMPGPEVSLSALLKTKSPYHNAFIKVHDIITNEIIT